MEIRAYERGDLDALLNLFYDTVHTVNLGDYTQAQVDAWADGRPDRSAWAKSLAAHCTLVAVIDGDIVGFGDIDEDGYLDRLYVHHAFQGRGVATALCDRLEAHVPAKAVTTHASITALPFFLRRGYRLTRPQTVLRNGVALTNFALVKPPAAIEHTYLFRPLRWMMQGTYFDAEGAPSPLRGEATVTREGQTWRLRSCFQACGKAPRRFCCDAAIEKGDAPGRLRWAGVDPALGALCGTFEMAGPAIFSSCISQDEVYSGRETLFFRDARRYDSAGVVFYRGARLFAWTARLRACDD